MSLEIAFVNRMLGMVVGGGEIWDLEMARQLEDQGANITFFTGEPLFSSPQFRYENESFSVEFVSTPHLQERALAAPIGIGGLLSDIDRQIFTSLTKERLSDDFDIIHVNSRPQFLQAAKSFDTPMTIKMNGPPHSLMYDHLLPGASSYDFFELADAVIGTGETPDLITERTGLNVHTINPGVGTSAFTPDGPTVEFGDGPTLLWVGRFVPAKDLSLLIKAFAELQESHPDASAYLIGDGPKQIKIKQLVEKHNIADSVQFLGRIDHEELPRYYRSADVFTLTSQTENHPIAMMEAMSSATPPVAPSVGWITEMIDHGRDGIVVENRTPSDFANAWEKLLTNPSERDRLGTRARDTACTRFEWGNKAKQLLDIFQRVHSI